MLEMTKKDFVYSRIGMALVSAQRVEYVTGKILENLIEFDKSFYGVTTKEFLDKSSKAGNGKRTLGAIFTLLKLNRKLVIESELDAYLKKRNLLAHGFWTTYLRSDVDGKEAVDFCYDFGKHSERIESFFKGFLYFLVLHCVKDSDSLPAEIKLLRRDFEYFLSSLEQTKLK